MSDEFKCHISGEAAKGLKSGTSALWPINMGSTQGQVIPTPPSYHQGQIILGI